MILTSWSSVLRESFQGIWLGVADFLPKLIVALVVFIFGWVIGSVVDHLVQQIARALKIDSLLKNARFDSVLDKAGINLNVGAFIGGLIKWFIVVVFLVASLDIIGLDRVNDFLQSVVLLYLPRVIVAVFILLVAAVIADAVERIVASAAKAGSVGHANFLGSVSRWAIWVFAFLAALLQLGIASAFIQTLFTGVIVALSLAFGLSFGLGGQEAAGRYIEKLRSDIKTTK